MFLDAGVSEACKRKYAATVQTCCYYCAKRVGVDDATVPVWMLPL